MIISLGKYLNHLARPNVVVATNPAAARGFPAANLKDGTPTKIFKFGAVPITGIDGAESLERVGTIDLCLLKNPGAETNFTGWKRGGTGSDISDAQFNSGIKSWEINAQGYMYQDVLCRSGEVMRISGATRGDGGTCTAYFGIMNIDTGQSLNTLGEWWGSHDAQVGAGADMKANITQLGVRSLASWLSTSIEFTVEPYSATLKHMTKLRVVAACGGAGSGFVDDLVLVPGTDMCSLHGFNFPANMTVTVYSSDTGAFLGEEVQRFALTPFQPSFYEWLAAPFVARYLYFVLAGVRERLFLPFIGEMIFTQMTHLEISSRYSSALRASWMGSEKLDTAAKADKALASPARPVRSVNLPFRWFAESHYTQAREWFINRCRGDQEEILIAFVELDETVQELEPQAVLYGRVFGPRGFAMPSPNVRDSEAIQINEKDLPKPPKGEEI